jgi:regulator of sigma E protease
VAMNLLAAFVIFTILAVIGMPQIIGNQFTVKSDTKTVKQTVLVQSVEANSPASSIGLQDKDTLVSIGPASGSAQPIGNVSELPTTTESFAGQTIKLTFINGHGQQETKEVKLRSTKVVDASQSTKNPVGYLGVATYGSPNSFVIQKSTWSAPIVALGLMKQITVLTFQGLGHAVGSIFRGHPSQASSQVTGPVGVYVLLRNGSTLGYQFMLFIIAVISLSLAIINILPIPALDGGKLFFALIPRLFRKGKPLKQHTEEWVHGSGLAFLMLLFVLITIVDIRRYF